VLGWAKNVFDDRVPDPSFFLPHGKNAALVGALDDTAAWLVARFGSADPSTLALGTVHRAQFAAAHPGLVQPATPVPGSDDTVNVAAAGFFTGGQPRELFTVTSMALYRMTVGFGADGVPEASLNFAGGTSEDPSSPFHGDQMRRWTESKHVALPFRRADVEKSKTHDKTIRRDK
jgi:acyl-homoserine lactone acylase PvdQ